MQNVADEKVAVRAGRHPGKIGFAVVERRRHPEIFEKPVQTQFIVIAEFGHRHRNGAAFEAAERLQQLFAGERSLPPLRILFLQSCIFRPAVKEG